MDEQCETEVIKKIKELKFKWEKVPGKPVYRTETQNFVIYVETAAESMDVHIKKKDSNEACKIYRSQYTNNKADWIELTTIKNYIEKEIKSEEAYLLREFIKDKPKEDRFTESKVVYVEDDLMDNNRTA